eukprot:SAG25_NODE_5854_length_613_cov_2.194553_1_plen_58_part_10
MASLRWGDTELRACGGSGGGDDLPPPQEFELVIASDVVYRDSHTPLLWRSIGALLSSR